MCPVLRDEQGSPLETSNTAAPAPGQERPSDVSIVVPCFNEERYVESLLVGLARQEQAVREMILVDGGSTDGTVATVERFRRDHPDLPLVVLRSERCSIARALNIGVARAQGDVIVRLDAHSSPHPGYLRSALAALRLPRAGVVGGGWEIRPCRSGLVAAAIAHAVSDAFGSGGARYRDPRRGAAPIDVDTVPFGCFSKQLWTTLHGFDERLLANEDYDFNYRVRRAGLRVILDPAIRSDYFARGSLRELARQYFRYGWWKAEMLKLHPLSLRWRQAVPALFVAALLGLLLSAAAFPPSRPVLFGLLALYAAVAFLASARICARFARWRLLPLLPFVFAVLHVSWGAAVLCNVLSFGLGPHAASPRQDGGR